MNGELDELNRMATSFSTVIRQQGEQIDTGLRSLSTALDQAAARLAAVLPGGTGSALPAVATAGGGLGGGVAGAVRVVNDRASPIPVFVVNAPAAATDGGGGNWLTSIFSGIGSAVGSLFTGVFGAIAAPILGLADLVVAVSGAITLVAQVNALVGEIRAFAQELVSSIRGLITLLFDSLTAAGIFPVSRLIASLLFLIDRGITLVLMHVQPIIVWLERVIEAVTAWLGRYVERIVALLGAYVNAAATFAATYITYLIDNVFRPTITMMVYDLIAGLAGLFFAAILAAGRVLSSAADYFAGVIARLWAQLENILIGIANVIGAQLGRLGINVAPIASVAVPAAPAAPDFAAAARAGGAEGRQLGRDLADVLRGPPPTRADAGRPPRFRGPGFHAPELTLPDMPQPGPELERLLTSPPTAEGAPTAPHPVTVNGGVTVQIRSETVSMDNAEATARVIATHLVDELSRLTQADRFGRGLPTASVA